jgi:hypothetical protein
MKCRRSDLKWERIKGTLRKCGTLTTIQSVFVEELSRVKSGKRYLSLTLQYKRRIKQMLSVILNVVTLKEEGDLKGFDIKESRWKFYPEDRTSNCRLEKTY